MTSIDIFHADVETVPPRTQPPAPFITAAELRKALTQACRQREKLRAEMIALQEEMDWLV